jgi:phage baseplate assembly protein gpV
VPDDLDYQEVDESRNHAIIHDQMISNVVQIGKIVKPQKDDPKKPLKKACVLVHIGGEDPGSYTRNWMTWVTSRAGYDAEWWMPEIDEQVVVVAPSGNLALGVIIGMVFRGDWLCLKTKGSDDSEPQFAQKIPADEQSHIHRKVYEDGSDITYDRKKHAFSIDLKEKQDAEKVGLSITSLVKEKKGELNIKLGEEEKEQTIFDLKTGTAEVTAPQGIKFIVGESIIEMKEDTVTIKQGDSVVDIKKDKITLKSKTIELDAGSKLTVSSSGADVT